MSAAHAPSNELLAPSEVTHPVRVLDPQPSAQLSIHGMRNEVASLFARLRPEIKQLIDKYLDRRIRRRIDTSDVAQSAYIDVHERLSRYLVERPMEVRSWMFFLAKMKALETNQHHLASQKRAVAREDNGFELRSLGRDDTSPSLAVSKQETQDRLQTAIQVLPERYRQVIELRHVQGLSNQEASLELGISQKAASKLYVRALNVLQRSLSA